MPFEDGSMRNLLLPYAPSTMLTSTLIDRLAVYLELLLRWNRKTNLTSIRNPASIVERHFGESLFTAAHLSPTGTLLDYGSGAGFPGIPIQLALPQLSVTLAESQSKKAAFLSEAARVLELPMRVLPRRVEEAPQTPVFDVVTMRAVDKMERSLKTATGVARRLCILSSTDSALEGYLSKAFDVQLYAVPNSTRRTLVIADRRKG